MVKLLIGVKGTGKTKALVEAANKAVAESNGAVVVIEKGNQLTFNVNYNCRLIDTEEYNVDNIHSLFGLIAGIFASNHDVTDLFVDSTLKICGGDASELDAFVAALDKLSDKVGANCVLAVSIPTEEASEFVKKHI